MYRVIATYPTEKIAKIAATTRNAAGIAAPSREPHRPDLMCTPASRRAIGRSLGMAGVGHPGCARSRCTVFCHPRPCSRSPAGLPNAEVGTCAGGVEVASPCCPLRSERDLRSAAAQHPPETESPTGPLYPPLAAVIGRP